MQGARNPEESPPKSGICETRTYMVVAVTKDERNPPKADRWGFSDSLLGEEELVEEVTKDDLHPCLIFIDKEGRWYHKGVEMIHRDYIRLFFDHMALDPQGRYVITWKGERCYVDVEDTAYVVRSIGHNKTGQDGQNRFTIFLSDDSRETLMADTLFLGEDNVPYCKVKNGAFPARFNRAAYYQLAEHIEEENGAYYLPSGGKKYPIIHRPS